MTIFNAFILGLVEGITEFLPVSSTFHLIIAGKLLGLPDSSFVKLFEVVIQSGAILSVFLLYAKDIKNNPDLVKKIFVSFLPTAAIGFLLYKTIKNVFFESNSLMIGTFFAIGLLFILVELLVKKGVFTPKKPLSTLSYKDAFIIGLLQSLAVIPGVSRAGIVIVGTLMMGFKRSEAAYYSFLLAVPTILAAGIFDLYKSKDALSSVNNTLLLFVGFATACIFAYLSMKWLIDFLKKNSLIGFGLYRILLTIVLIVFGV